MKFEELTEASQQAARRVFSEMLLIKFKSELALPDGTVKYLGRRVREAFVSLESEEPKTEMCCGSDICSGLSTDAPLSSGGLGIQQGVGLAMNSDTANQLKRKGML